MLLSVIGVSFQSCPLEKRQLFSFSSHNEHQTYRSFENSFPGKSVVFVSTCNRVEIYSNVFDYEELLKWWAQFCAQNYREIQKSSFFKIRYGALRHLVDVCSGIDSMVIGENQILGQIKQAYLRACDENCVFGDLRLAFEQAFCITKLIKTQTILSSCQVSVVSIAVSRALENDPFLSKKFLLIGAGQTAEMALRYLHQDRNRHLTIINRTDDKALSLAKKYGIDYLAYSSLIEDIQKYDIILSATSCRTPIILEKYFPENQKKQWFIIDIGVPLNCESSIKKREDITLICVDSLQEEASRNNLSRKSQVAYAQDIIETQLQKFIRKVHKKNQASLIKDYISRCQDIKKQLVEQALAELKNHDPQEVIEKLAHRLTQKIMHEPLKQISESYSPKLIYEKSTATSVNE